MRVQYFIYLVWLFLLISSCRTEKLEFKKGELKIEVEVGKNWLHEYPLFWNFHIDNPPQFAIWIEDILGNYLSTVFVTYKIATESWLDNDGNRRVEALPHWCHKRAVVYKDGLLLPTKENPVVDALTGATPQEDKEFKLNLKNLKYPLIIKAEFNHSVDFNSYFPKSAKLSDNNYSGGKEGSGQPAVVYQTILKGDIHKLSLNMIGYSSPDGKDGDLRKDFDKLTSAKEIVKSINVEVK
jgi:hypothetical protein